MKGIAFYKKEMMGIKGEKESEVKPRGGLCYNEGGLTTSEKKGKGREWTQGYSLLDESKVKEEGQDSEPYAALAVRGRSHGSRVGKKGNKV